jgi:predicted outer membrane protein
LCRGGWIVGGEAAFSESRSEKHCVTEGEEDMSRKVWTRGTLAAVAVLGLGIVAFAQQPGTLQNQNPNIGQQPNIQQPNWNQRPGMMRRGEPANMQANFDHEMVTWLRQVNQDEIKLGNLAEKNSSDKQVKDFGKRMVEDHTKLLNGLEKFTAGMEGTQGRVGNRMQGQRGAFNAPGQNQFAHGQQQPGVGNQAGVGNQGGTRPGAIGGQPGAAGNQAGVARNWRSGQRGLASTHTHGFARILDEAFQQNAEAMDRDLSEKHGSDFDAWYISSQLFDHMAVCDALKVFERYASPEIQPTLKEAQQIVHEHEQLAKDLFTRVVERSGASGTTATHTPIGRPNQTR